MFSYAFLAMTAYNILRPATRSQFIATLGSDNIPYVQLAAGLLIGVLMQGYSRASNYVPRRWVVPLTQGLEVAALLVFWALFRTGAPWVPVAFYVFGLMLGILLISQFWTLANDVYDPRQAKRLFGFIGGGASLGGAMGAGLTAVAVERVGTNDLLLVSSTLLALCTGVVWAIARYVDTRPDHATADERGVGGGEALRLLLDSRHLQVITLVIASAAIGAAIIEQQLNMAAEAIKGAESTDAITGFLAQVTFYTSVIGFVVQVGLTSRIHRLLGIGFALLLLPIGLGATAVVILLNGALWAPAAARVLDTSLRYSIDKTTREVLFLPLPSALKHRAKPFIDVTMDRLAKAAGALLLLVLIKPWGLHLDWQQLSVASLVVMVVWIGVARVAHREYLLSFRRGLGARDLSPGAVRLDVADAATIETLVEELSSPDESSVLYAIGLLETLDRPNLITPLLRHHPSARVRARALAAVSSAEDVVLGRWSSAVEAMLADDDQDVRAAAVRLLARRAGSDAETLMRRYVDDADPRVAVTAATVLATSSRAGDTHLAQATFRRLLAGSVKARREVAVGLARVSTPDFRPLLIALLQDADTDVACEAIRSVRARGDADPLYVPALVSLLAHRVHKREARETLVAYGPSVIQPLVFFLRDRDEAPWVRRHLPATLAGVGTQAAVDALVEALDDPDGLLRFKALEAVEAVHRADSSLRLPRPAIEALIGRDVMRHANCLTLRCNVVQVDPGSVGSLIVRALDDKMARTVDRVFRLLGLIYPWRDIAAVRFTLEHAQARARASAVEYLDNIMAGSLRRRVLAMLDDASPDEKVRQAFLLLRSRPRGIEETLVQLIHDDDPVISAAAIHYVGERQLWGLADDLEFVLKRRAAGDRHVFGAAWWVLASRQHGEAQRAAWLEPLPEVEVVARVRDVPLFRDVFIDEVFRIVDAGHQVGHERGEAIHGDDAVPACVQILVEGTLRRECDDGRSEEMVAPALLGVDAVLSDRPRLETVTAVERSVTVRISDVEFRAKVADSEPLARALFRLYLTGNDPAGWETQSGQTRLAGPLGPGLQPIDKVFLLRAHPLFGRATVEQCLQIVAATREVPLVVGAIVLSQAERPAIHLVVSGEVKLEAEGRESIRVGAGHTIGVAEALGGASQGWTATVITEGRALYLAPEDLFAVLGDHADLIRSLLAGVIDGRGARR